MRIIGILEFLCDSENFGGDEDHRGSSADSEAALHILQFLPSRRNHRPKALSRGSRTDRHASEKSPVAPEGINHALGENQSLERGRSRFLAFQFEAKSWQEPERPKTERERTVVRAIHRLKRPS